MNNFNFVIKFYLVIQWIIGSTLAVPLIQMDQDVDGLVQRMLPDDDADAFLQIFNENYDILAGLDFNSIFSLINGGIATNESCNSCETLIKLVTALPYDQKSLELAKALACQTNNLGQKISLRECEGIIDRLGMPILYILQNTKVPMNETCSVLLGHKCQTFFGRPVTKWTNWQVDISEKSQTQEFEKPLEIFGCKSEEAVNNKTYKVLHLTDVHLDIYYTEGSNAQCNEALCCRSTSFVIQNESLPAGYWGQLVGDCDIPLRLVRNSLEQIRREHPDVEIIFWTGDNVPHDVWNTSIYSVLKHNQMVTDLIKEIFPDVQVFPVLGNHEAHPINMFVPMEVAVKSNDEHSMKWLYNEMSDKMWSQWLTEENRETFKHGGFYTKLVSPKWRIIVLNSNGGYLANFWRAYDPIDPDGQLAWLVKQLDLAERAGQKVSILGHIPLSNMYEAWKHNYISICDRYSKIITGGYQGHTHNDELEIMYNHEGKPIGVNYVSGSLTTFSYLNPSYKIFTMDQEGQPIDYEVYYLDLDYENQLAKKNKTEPVWIKEFQATKSYDLENLKPESWDHFIKRAEQNSDLMYRYSGHYHRHSMEYPSRNKLNTNQVKILLKQIKNFSPFSDDKLEF